MTFGASVVFPGVSFSFNFLVSRNASVGRSRRESLMSRVEAKENTVKKVGPYIYTVYKTRIVPCRQRTESYI